MFDIVATLRVTVSSDDRFGVVDNLVEKVIDSISS